MSQSDASAGPRSPVPGPGSKDIVLAFSGGLDTSFCIPYLQAKGYAVHTVFADTGGVDEEERDFIEKRAAELGAASHVTVDGGPAIWSGFVKPFVWAGEGYQGQYPLLVSDRYLIVDAALKRADALGTRIIAHGCTGMGNDQVRFDLAVKALGDYEIVAPIREIQKEHTQTRAYEQKYLEERGFGVRAKQKAYTINENLLGVTMSGGEIDRWEAPGEGTRGWCAPRSAWPIEPLTVTLKFEHGEAVSVDGKPLEGAKLLAKLNKLFAPYGVGRGMYTGDTVIGLKGRIVFEAPGLIALLAAHRALEDAVLTKQQNRFKPDVARKWVELVYEGFYHDPLKTDLEAFLDSSQAKVNGEVTLETRGGRVDAVAVKSPHLLNAKGATYAQSADWGVAEAEGFIKLFGMSSTLYAQVNRG
ncbi:argininosuccinate synthase [Xanthomonas graminis]|jgi:argininosuccinate synthase|uniref:Argininosuccinate synthase n=1 Tax=Xanthomonas graminis pv. graminis TaxID=134874 RepID=A0A1M4IM03_9XANT|nr:argininosuccinate synthase [Xanthomonas translucens]EKU24889.1 argininosuccinate synthase [Xanthomonas translucens pv. graminis ART-Xtg29]OAX61949.1 argininosuccinate synthase [Xanthomonas translucens pv. graminis]UKE55639.1 argininosuccinate synthase [Xanthomonas translucens pv. graminis]WIH10013.1 argininosuccinate synthase [Xanthomonas translucens pv. graminis]WIH11251.1 argininosuccinate synthase [Xanthomonas translucens pv. graminis]